MLSNKSNSGSAPVVMQDSVDADRESPCEDRTRMCGDRAGMCEPSIVTISAIRLNTSRVCCLTTDMTTILSQHAYPACLYFNSNSSKTDVTTSSYEGSKCCIQKMCFVARINLCQVSSNTYVTTSSYEGSKCCIQKMCFVARINLCRVSSRTDVTTIELKRSLDFRIFGGTKWLSYSNLVDCPFVQQLRLCHHANLAHSLPDQSTHLCTEIVGIPCR